MPTVLVVEDEWAIADWLHGLLSEEGYQVRLAINGQQALDVIAHGKPDVILAFGEVHRRRPNRDAHDETRRTLRRWSQFFRARRL